MVPLHGGVRNTNQGVQRGTWLFHHPPLHYVGSRLWLHPMLWLENVKTPWRFYVCPILYVRRGLLKF